LGKKCPRCHQSDDYQIFELPKDRVARQPIVCPTCKRKVILISITLAAKVLGKSRQTIYDWKDEGIIGYVLDAKGRPLIIYSSLFLPLDDEVGEDSLSTNGSMVKQTDTGYCSQ
jgi:hypothetical protein